MKTNQLLIAVGAILVALTADAQPQPSATTLPRYAEGELLVKFADGPHGAFAKQAGDRMRHEVKRRFDFIGWQHIQLPRGMTVEQGLARYRNLPGVLAVEPNGLMRAIEPVASNVDFQPKGSSIDAAPNDPMFPQQWGLAKIGAPSAWVVTTGSTNVVVAVIDTGINYNHEDLAANMWRNPGEIPSNGIDDDGNGHIDDIHGIDTAGNDSDPIDDGFMFDFGIGYHGTACASVIGAAGNNSRGITGVNWSVQLLACRIALTNFLWVADMVEGLDYVHLMKGRGVNIRVVSMSIAFFDGFFSQAIKDASDRLAARGILQVAAIGNESLNADLIPVMPATFNTSNLISVAASDQVDDLARFSSYGRTNVDLAAPGVDIAMASGATTNTYYPAWWGTSFACPYVSGAAALLFAANPSATAAEVKAALLETVDVLPAFTNKMVSNGRLNVGRAIRHPAAVPDSPPFIAVPPQSRTTNEGASASFSVTAYGARPLFYQWQRQGEALAGGTNVSLNLTNLTTAHAGDYSVVVSNAFGTLTSAVASLTVRTFPRLIGPLTPLQLSAVPGETVTLSVETTGTLPISYRWRHLRTNGTSANLTNLVLDQHTCFVTLTVDTNSAGTYTVILTSVVQPSSSIQRTNAVLTVLADSDADGLPDRWETTYTNATDPAADTDHDGLTNWQEYQAGTDPTNALSRLRLDTIALAGESNRVALRFAAAANKTYTIQHRSAVEGGAWSRLTDIPASSTNRLIEVLDTNGPLVAPRNFFRLVTPRLR